MQQESFNRGEKKAAYLKTREVKRRIYRGGGREMEKKIEEEKFPFSLLPLKKFTCY